MDEQDSYFTIDKSGAAEYKDRGSKFIAFAYPVKTVEECKKRLEETKKLHPKATHHCYAYRLGTDKNIFRVNDDGEPSGTAGKPILGQIDSKRLTNVLVIVVRYFGGTLLGVPGLINAYKAAAALSLQVTATVQKTIEIRYQIQFNYTQINEVMMIIKQFQCTVWEQDMNLFCRMTIGIPKARLEEVVYRLKEIRGLEIMLELR
jgi:uncharacterized YigZ family protein